MKMMKTINQSNKVIGMEKEKERSQIDIFK